jgi:hypothetical protein
VTRNTTNVFAKRFFMVSLKDRNWFFKALGAFHGHRYEKISREKMTRKIPVLLSSSESTSPAQKEFEPTADGEGERCARWFARNIGAPPSLAYYDTKDAGITPLFGLAESTAAVAARADVVLSRAGLRDIGSVLREAFVAITVVPRYGTAREEAFARAWAGASAVLRESRVPTLFAATDLADHWHVWWCTGRDSGSGSGDGLRMDEEICGTLEGGVALMRRLVGSLWSVHTVWWSPGYDPPRCGRAVLEETGERPTRVDKGGAGGGGVGSGGYGGGVTALEPRAKSLAAVLWLRPEAGRISALLGGLQSDSAGSSAASVPGTRSSLGSSSVSSEVPRAKASSLSPPSSKVSAPLTPPPSNSSSPAPQVSPI